MQKTGVWGFDNRWALTIWGILLLGSTLYLASATRAYLSEPPRTSYEDCPACYFRAAEPVGLQAFYFGHLWLIGIALSVGRRWAVYRRGRVILLTVCLLVVLVAGHWIQVQSEKKGLFVGRGPDANEGLRKTQGVSWVAKASLGVVPTTPDAQDVARQDAAARA